MRCRVAITLLRSFVALRLRRRINRSRLRLLTRWFSGPRGLSRRLTLLHRWWRIWPVLRRFDARLLLWNWSRSIRLMRWCLALLNGRRLGWPVLSRWRYARLLLWNRRWPIRLYGLRLALLNGRGLERPVLRRRNWFWPIRLHRLCLLLR